MPIQIAIADDHQVLIEGLCLLLQDEADICIAGQAGNGIQLLHLLEEQPVDVVLMDINMPGMDGLEACRRIRKAFPQTQVLALTMYDKGKMIRRMLKAGASGYLLKNTGRDELVEAIKKVAAGETYLSNSANQALLDHLRHGPSPDPPSAIPELTRREQQILQLIAQELTTPEISEKLNISLNTVDTHRKNLLAKLGAKNMAGAVRIAMEKGLL